MLDQINDQQSTCIYTRISRIRKIQGAAAPLRHPKWRGASDTDRLLHMRGSRGRNGEKKTDAQRDVLRAHLREISSSG